MGETDYISESWVWIKYQGYTGPFRKGKSNSWMWNYNIDEEVKLLSRWKEQKQKRKWGLQGLFFIILLLLSQQIFIEYLHNKHQEHLICVMSKWSPSKPKLHVFRYFRNVCKTTQFVEFGLRTLKGSAIYWECIDGQ